MKDEQIVNMYMERDETALEETEKKYGHYCFMIAHNILGNREDADESVNDTYFCAWNIIPPTKPQMFSAFLGKITRNLSLKKHRRKMAKKRGGSEVETTLDELSECIPDSHNIEEEIQTKELTHIIDTFLRTLPETERQVFIRRYWYFDSIDHISKTFDFGESKVKMMLMRTRQKLLKVLSEEDLL